MSKVAERQRPQTVLCDCGDGITKQTRAKSGDSGAFPRLFREFLERDNSRESASIATAIIFPLAEQVSKPPRGPASPLFGIAKTPEAKPDAELKSMPIFAIANRHVITVSLFKRLFRSF